MKEYDELGRPLWDDYFIAISFVIAQRSLDKHTKCGCVVVDSGRSILSTGYNSPPRGCVDSKMPLERPHKYKFMEHSESAAIINAARLGVSLIGSTFYITGPPCHMCFAKILSVGAKEIVYGPNKHSTYKEEEEIINKMREGQNIEIREHKSYGSINRILSLTQKYFKSRLG